MNSPLLMIEVQESISLKTADNYIKTFVQLPFVFYSFLLFWFILLRDYIFRYRNFLSKTKFAKTETFFLRPYFLKPMPKPSKICNIVEMEKFRN